MKNQIFRSHIKTTFGGMKTHRDDTCMTFSAHYGPYASKQLNEKGKLEAMPVPSFACWMGTDGVALFDNSDKYNILPLAHCSPGKEEGVGEEDRLSFILPLVENRIILT